MFADQLTHILKHATQPSETTPFLYGHIANYDPLQHRVRCMIPSMTDQDGKPLQSPWMPMGTALASKGAGIQMIYEGGATVDNPTGGEQVMIAMFGRNRGVSAVPCMFFHATNPPPATNLPLQSDGYSKSADPIAPGDVIISAASQTDGGANSFIRVRKAGNIEIWSAAALNADVVGDINVTTNTGNLNATVVKGNLNVLAKAGDANLTVTAGNTNVTIPAGNATVTASGTVSIIASSIVLAQAIGAAVHALCTDVFQFAYNRHTHPSGGFPNPQADATTMTSIVKAD